MTSQEIKDILDTFLHRDFDRRSKQIINVCVDFLTEDPVWLKENISQVDKEILKEIVNKL